MSQRITARLPIGRRSIGLRPPNCFRADGRGRGRLTLIGWVSVEMVVLAGLGSLAWALYLVLGVCIAAIGVAWWRSSTGPDAVGS